MLGSNYLKKIVEYIKAHPHFITLHEDLVKEIENVVQDELTGKLTVDSLLPVLLSIMQLMHKSN